MLTEQRRIDLESAGYCIGDAEDFLELTQEEIEMLEFKYRGYKGKIEFDHDCNLWCGRVSDLTDVVTFKGVTIIEVNDAFIDSVDDYLEMCK